MLCHYSRRLDADTTPGSTTDFLNPKYLCLILPPLSTSATWHASTAFVLLFLHCRSHFGMSWRWNSHCGAHGVQNLDDVAFEFTNRSSHAFSNNTYPTMWLASNNLMQDCKLLQPWSAWTESCDGSRNLEPNTNKNSGGTNMGVWQLTHSSSKFNHVHAQHRRFSDFPILGWLDWPGGGRVYGLRFLGGGRIP